MLAYDFDFSDGNAQQYERAHDQAIKIVGGDSQFFYENRLRLLRRYHGDLQPRTIIDFGCGRGRMTDVFARAYPAAAITGFDVSAQSIDVARRTYGHRASFCTEIPKGASYNLIVASGVFHHILPEKQCEELRNVGRFLAHGGVIVLFEHNPWNPVTQWIVRHEPFDFTSYLISPHRMRHLVSDAGLELEALRFTTFFPSYLAPLLPCDRALAWCPLGGQYMVSIRQRTPS